MWGKIRIIILGLFFCLTSCHKHQVHHYQGYIEGENLYLASPYSGKLIHNWVKRGSHVKKGQKLFSLDDNPQILAIKEAEAVLSQGTEILSDLQKPKRKPEIEAIMAQIEQADAQIQLAKLRYHRNQTLYSKHAIDMDSVDGAKEHWLETLKLKAQFEANLDLAKLGARENQIKAQQSLIASSFYKLEQIKWQLSQKTVYAPSDGIIFDTLYYPGEFVPEAKPVMVFLPPKHMRVEFFVPVTDLPLLQLKKVIQFSYAGSSAINEAVINYISPSVEYAPPVVYSRENNDKLVYRVKAVLKEPWHNHPGMPVDVAVTQYE